MQQPSIIEFRQIRNVPEILNVTGDFIRQNFRLFWRALLFLAFPPIVVGVTIFSYFFVSFFATALNDGDVAGMILPMMGAYLVGGVLCGGGAAMLIGVVHVFVALYRERGPNNFTIEDVWRGTKEIFWMLFWTLFGLQVGVSIIGALAAFVPFGQIGLYIGITFASLYFPLRIYERRGFIQSITVSSKLIEQRWWATFGMLWLFYLLMFGLSGVLMIPIYAVVWAASTNLIDIEALGNSMPLLRLVGTALISAYMTGLFLLGAIPFLSMIFHYYSQRERKGGVALMEAIEGIGTAHNVQ